MRDPARIDRMIESLREVWHASPDMRLGQLLVDVIRPGEPCPRVFYAEDTDTEAKLAKYPEPVANSSAGSGNTLELTRAEALVLFGLLDRSANTDRLGIEHPAEAKVLLRVCALLQKQLTELFDPDWLHLIANARSQVAVAANEK